MSWSTAISFHASSNVLWALLSANCASASLGDIVASEQKLLQPGCGLESQTNNFSRPVLLVCLTRSNHITSVIVAPDLYLWTAPPPRREPGVKDKEVGTSKARSIASHLLRKVPGVAQKRQSLPIRAAKVFSQRAITSLSVIWYVGPGLCLAFHSSVC